MLPLAGFVDIQIFTIDVGRGGDEIQIKNEAVVDKHGQRDLTREIAMFLLTNVKLLQKIKAQELRKYRRVQFDFSSKFIIIIH